MGFTKAILLALFALSCVNGAPNVDKPETMEETSPSILSELLMNPKTEEGSASSLSEVVVKPEELEESSSRVSKVVVKPSGAKVDQSKEKLDTSDSFGVPFFLPHHLSRGHHGLHEGYGHGYGHPHHGLPPPAIHAHHPPPPPIVLKHPLAHMPVYVYDYYPGFHYAYRNHGFGGGYLKDQGHLKEFGHIKEFGHVKEYGHIKDFGYGGHGHGFGHFMGGLGGFH